MKQDFLIMSQKEINRLHVVKKVISKELTQEAAGKLVRLSSRQIRRIVKKVVKEGEKGVLHKSRGQPSHHRISTNRKSKVIKIYEKKYLGFGAKLASEKLESVDGIKVSKETLRKWLLSEGLIVKKRKVRKHRTWRARKQYYGEMIQMDGSHHDWLEGRGERMVLMGYIDDATNRIHGKFYEYEGTIPAMDSFKEYIRKYGIPQSVYLDRHSTYKVTHYQEWKACVFGDKEEKLSQFERALKELGVRVIHANSAPAKGRIERLFRTLQDRLVKEMRLAGINTLEEANKFLGGYLKDHNSRYLIEPVRQANLHRKAPPSRYLDEILCKKIKHTLRNDFTVAHDKKLYQVMEYTSSKQVEFRELVNGQQLIVAKGRKLKFKEIQKPIQKRRVKLSQKIKVRVLDKNRSYGTYKARPKPTLTFN